MGFPVKVEVWLVNTSGATGHEQKGIRPAAIWKDLDHVKMAIGIPFTTSLFAENLPYTIRILPTIKNGLTEDSTLLIHQIRSFDKFRLIKKLGELEESDISDVAIALKEMLKL